MKTQAKDMTKGHPGRLLLQFALPLMLGNIFQQTYTMVDTAVRGTEAALIALCSHSSEEEMRSLSAEVEKTENDVHSVFYSSYRLDEDMKILSVDDAFETITG